MPSGWDIKVRTGHQTPAADVAGADDPAAGDTGQLEHLADRLPSDQYGTLAEFLVSRSPDGVFVRNFVQPLKAYDAGWLRRVCAGVISARRRRGSEGDLRHSRRPGGKSSANSRRCGSDADVSARLAVVEIKGT
jgi:hypothetical protein